MDARHRASGAGASGAGRTGGGGETRSWRILPQAALPICQKPREGEGDVVRSEASHAAGAGVDDDEVGAASSALELVLPIRVVLVGRGAQPGTLAQERVKAGHAAHDRPLFDRGKMVRPQPKLSELVGTLWAGACCCRREG